MIRSMLTWAVVGVVTLGVASGSLADRQLSISVKSLAQAPDFSTEMDELVRNLVCDLVDLEAGGFSATVVHRQGFLLSAEITYDRNASTSWQNAVDAQARLILGQLTQDMGAGTRDSDPGNGPITSGTIKVETSK